MPEPNEVEEEKIANYLIQSLVEKASGRSDAECHRNQPRDKYFIGNLAPVPLEFSPNPETSENDESDDRFSLELQSKLCPFSFGGDILCQPEDGETVLKVNLEWSVYYKVFPSLSEQQNWQHALLRDVEGNEEGEESNSSSETENRSRSRTPTESMYPKYKKIECSASGECTITSNGSEQSDLVNSINAEISRALEVVRNDPDRVRGSTTADEPIRIPETALQSEESFAQFVSSLRTEIIPSWSLQTNFECRDVNSDRFTVGFEFTNTSNVRYDDANREGFLFDTRAKLAFVKGRSLPFEIELVPRGFRYDRFLWGHGFNCSLDKFEDSDCYVTNHTPIHVQRRYQTRNEPDAVFQRLADDPIETLRTIADAMNDYVQVWDDFESRYAEQIPDWSSAFASSFADDKARFEDEITLFRNGVDLIEDSPDILLAFQLTNQTFERMRPGGKWRLFQLVFVVSQIPGIAALQNEYQAFANEREKVDIVYFPTGGGKTEAYLGTIVFHCFNDRLRGKRGGVTAWTRFPLRLLTLQQTQRGADAIGLADLVRRSHPDPRLSGENIDEFAIGYFVGQGGSPNEITPPNDYNQNPPEWAIAQDVDRRQQFKRVVRCPSCKTDTVRIDFDQERIRLMHRCTNSDCQFPSGRLPVYVVDNEIYRYLPALVVGTIDKLAGLGNQRKISMLFGAVDGRCPVHGYLKQSCCQKNCQDRASWTFDVAHQDVSGVTLFVQDELHLLKEGLGTFDSHYESFSQRIRQEFGHSDSLKIIASSATIEEFEHQVFHLYARNRDDARCFPGLGPSNSESFYATTEAYPQRIFVGIIPHNKTILNAVLELLEIYHRNHQLLIRIQNPSQMPFDCSYSVGSAEFASLTDIYKTSLSYFLSNRQLSEIHTDINGDVNGNLAGEGLTPIIPRELTGGTSTTEVTEILDHLEGESAMNDSADCVLATSMISHGVDVDRFNAMFFYGMPRLNAEYIQASSRVGRKHIGIVFDCFHPIRERDRSHYDYFRKFHEYLGQLVEPVAINRWSKFSVQRTVPGLFMGVLLQLLANRGTGNPNRYYMKDHVLRQITSGQITEGDFRDFLKSAYQVETPTNPAQQAFSDEIDRLVGLFFNQIIGAASATFVSEALNPSPMRSLRDVDEPVTIELDSFGTTWANNVSRS